MEGPAKAPTLVGGRRRWRLRTGDRTDALRSSAYPPLLQRLLANRGVRTPDEARRFLDGASSFPGEGLDPFLLPDMDRAVQRLRLALRRGELVAVFADFDVDGVTAAAVLGEGLEALGGRVLTHIPDRFQEGYGLNIGAIDRLRAQGAELLLTADCGTSSVAEVEHARALGMDVLILDHHAVPASGRLPPAQALVNPKLLRKELGSGNSELGTSPLPPSSQFPVPGSMEGLAAVGLAYQLMAALHEAQNAPFDPGRCLDLVALGTVVDMAPLMGANRGLVRRGLTALAHPSGEGRPGLRALMKVAGIDPARVDTEALSFALGPRLNAAGRIASARLAYDLLVTRDEAEATRLAERLDELNRQRQLQTLEALSLAWELLDAEDLRSPLVMVGHADFSSGIVGLVAARLAEELYRPAVVYELGESTSRASARSIPEFDIVGALRQAQDEALRQAQDEALRQAQDEPLRGRGQADAGLFLRFGGHRQAAGFTADNENLPAIKERLLEQAGRELAGLDLAPTIDVDAPMPLRALRTPEIRGLARLAPHGMGNPRPTFLSRAVTVLECQAVGTDGQHLRLKLRDGPVVWPAIAFRMGDGGNQEPGTGNRGEVLGSRVIPEPGSLIDIVYSLSADRRRQTGALSAAKERGPSKSSGRSPSAGSGRSNDRLELEILDFVASTSA